MFRLTHPASPIPPIGLATPPSHRVIGRVGILKSVEAVRLQRASELTRVARSTTSRHATRGSEGIVSLIELRVAQALFRNPPPPRGACANIPPRALAPSRPGTPFLSERKCSVVVSRHATRDFEGIVSLIELRVAQALFRNPPPPRGACANIPPRALAPSRPGTPFLSERKCSVVVVVVGAGRGKGWGPRVGEGGVGSQGWGHRQKHRWRHRQDQARVRRESVALI